MSNLENCTIVGCSNEIDPEYGEHYCKKCGELIVVAAKKQRSWEILKAHIETLEAAQNNDSKLMFK